MEKGRFLSELQSRIDEWKAKKFETKHPSIEHYPETKDGLVGGFYPEASEQELVLWQEDLMQNNDIYAKSVTQEWSEIDPKEDY